MTIDLGGCHMKITRAWEHREGLDAVVGPALNWESDPIQLSAKLDPDTGDHVFRVTAIPEEWVMRIGVILGDIVHNLRSALEYLFFELCCEYLGADKTERLGSQVQFPIEDCSQGLANKRQHFNKIPSSHWAIIDGAQPYQRTDLPKGRALRALRNLSNRDKHRVLNPLLLSTQVLRFTDALTVVPVGDALLAKHLKVGAEVLREPLGPDVDAEVEVAGYITPDIRLPEGDFRIVYGVSLMMSTVEGIVNDIEALT
jgi:hypothetical protein